MKVFDSISSVRVFLSGKRLDGSQIGLVPTMGALHKGHFKLVKNAIENNDVVVVSIFVNPTQFNKKEDLENYPRHLDQDIKALENIGCHAVFVPTESEMYPVDRALTFDVGYFEKIMEGKFRQGHFAGVAVVVSKLFNIIAPNRAYFGQKDLQQLTLIKNLVQELNFNLEIIEIATVREASGLAMSSRNKRLNDEQIKVASNIYKGLKTLESQITAGVSIKSARLQVEKFYNALDGFELEYLEVVNKVNLLPLEEFNPDIDLAICVAGYISDVRLLDNLCITAKS